jgi:hypothetical protein
MYRNPKFIGTKRHMQIKGVSMAKTFTAVVIFVNILLGVLLFLSNESIIASLAAGSHSQTPLLVTNFSIFSYVTTYFTYPGSPVAPALALSTPYYPFYIFMLALVLNICFIIKVLITKDKENKK